jgi:hypothetical protein
MTTSLGPLPSECIVHTFSYLEIPTLCRVASVCKQWFLCHSHNLLWIPIRDELKLPFCLQQQIPVKQQVLEWKKRLQPVEGVVKPLMDGEERFQLVLNGSLISLQEFQNLPVFNQFIRFWKGIREDSTCLLKLLIDKIQDVTYDLLCIPGGLLIINKSDIAKELQIGQVSDLRETQLLLSWTAAPLSPFNGNEIRAYLERSLASSNPELRTIASRTCQNIEQLQQCLPYLVKTQEL